MIGGTLEVVVSVAVMILIILIVAASLSAAAVIATELVLDMVEVMTE